MPRIEDILEKSGKKFKKKEYRPWTFNDMMKDDHDILPLSNSNDEVKYQVENKIPEIQNDLQPKLEKITQVFVPEITSKKIEKQRPSKPIVENVKQFKPTEILEPLTIQDKIDFLNGHQKTLFYFICEKCKSRNENNTGVITLNSLLSTLGIKKPMLKLTMIRLSEKKLIMRGKGRPGRGGYCIFFLPNEVVELLFKYPCFLDEDNNSFTAISSSKNLEHDSELHNLKVKDSNIPAEWSNINYELLSPIGFSKTQIMQLVDKNQPETVQESIYHFAYALEHNTQYKAHQNPLNLLMGVLRKGQAWIEKNYRSQQEIALEKLLEAKKAEKERTKKLEEEVYKLAFDEWTQSLSLDNIKEIKNSNKSPLSENMKMKAYFSENIWPKKRKEYLL